jgi:hypothetical protein
LRQFGNTVVALHNAHYRHVNEPDQSRSQAMHTWVKIGDSWQIVARHSARFEPYKSIQSYILPASGSY